MLISENKNEKLTAFFSAICGTGTKFAWDKTGSVK